MDYVDSDVARMVRTVAAHFDALAPQKSISYVVLAPAVVRAEVDPEKMERVLLNLLSNAFKFTPQGGRIQCTLKVNDGHLILAVQDSGPWNSTSHAEYDFRAFSAGARWDNP